MGQLFTRISTNSSPGPIIETNHLLASKSTTTISKRKHVDQENLSKKRKFDCTDRLPSSPRLSRSSSHLFNTSLICHSLSPMSSFKCQLCRRCFTTKDSYLDHMILCAMERHASIKIVRATKPYSIQL